MKELLQGRRLGFAPRSHLAFLAIGLGVAVTLVDLMAWFALGSRETNGYVIASQWICVAELVIVAIAAIMALVERVDVPEEERGIARLDVIASLAVVILYGASAVLRSLELGNAAPSPAPFLLTVAGLIVLVIDAGLAANIYSSREWEELEDEPVREHRRRRVAGR